jgi:hypothetical protein
MRYSTFIDITSRLLYSHRIICCNDNFVHEFLSDLNSAYLDCYLLYKRLQRANVLTYSEIARGSTASFVPQYLPNSRRIILIRFKRQAKHGETIS